MLAKYIFINIARIVEKINSNEVAHRFISILKLGKLYSIFLSFFLSFFLSRNMENPLHMQLRDVKILLDTTNYVPSWVYEHTYSKDPVEPSTFDLLNILVKEGSVVYDIGAEIGLMSLYCDLKGAKTYAFESRALCVSVLQKNKTLNHANKIKIIHAFVGYGENEFSIDKAELVPPDVVKMDIEGGEYRALKGMKNTIQKYKPFILLEMHPRKLSQEQRNWIDRFLKANYTNLYGINHKSKAYELVPLEDFKISKNYMIYASCVDIKP